MSWLPEERFPYSWWQSLLIKVLRCGALPSHVAFIMDGNRRFARQKGVETVEGHIQGFQKLAQTLQWCHDLGITQVTVYAFSIENYKRPQAEVDTLMNLARDKFRRLIGEADRFAEAGVRVCVLGNVGLLPDDLQDLIAQAEQLTKANSKATLNIAFSYTSRDEMTRAVRRLGQAVQQGHIFQSDINPHLVERCLYTCDNCSSSSSSSQPSASTPDRMTGPDLVVRTSGETRLSDFLLWQSAYSVTHFTQVLWPDLSLWHLLAAVFHYQSNQFYIQELFSQVRPDDMVTSDKVTSGATSQEAQVRVTKFLHLLEEETKHTTANSTEHSHKTRLIQTSLEP